MEKLDTKNEDLKTPNNESFRLKALDGKMYKAKEFPKNQKKTNDI